MMIINCCKNCPDRKPRCHIDCSEYLLQKKEAEIPGGERRREYYDYIKENSAMRKKKMNLWRKK